MLAVEFPLERFTDLDGSPLDGGSIYYGLPDLNPVTNQVAIFWDDAGTQQAAQPVRTSNGFAVRNGTPTAVYTAGDYSVSVYNRRGELVVSFPSSLKFSANSQLLANLANTASASLGPALIGYNPALAYPDGTMGAALNDIEVSVFRFMTPAQIASVKAFNFAQDVTAAILAALASGAKLVRMPTGGYLITAQIPIPNYVSVLGEGYCLFEGTGATRILKRGNFTGIVVRGAAQLLDVVVEGAPGNGGDGVQVLGGRSLLANVTSVLHGQDGIKVGDYAVSGANTNLWRVRNCISRANGRHGCFISHEGETTTPDVNAGTIEGLEVSYNAVDGLRIGEAVDNTITGLASQSNGGWGYHLMQYAKGNHIINAYTEVNTLGDYKLEVGADRNTINGFRSGQNQPDSSNLGADNIVISRYGSLSTLPLHDATEAFSELVLLEKTTSGRWHFYKEPATRHAVMELQGTSANADVLVRSNGGGAAGARFGTGGNTVAIRGLNGRLGVTLNFGAIGAGATGDVLVSVTGATSTDAIEASPTHAIPAGVVWAAWWDPTANAGAGGVKVRCLNTTGGAVTVNGAFNVLCKKLA